MRPRWPNDGWPAMASRHRWPRPRRPRRPRRASDGRPHAAHAAHARPPLPYALAPGGGSGEGQLLLHLDLPPSLGHGFAHLQCHSLCRALTPPRSRPATVTGGQDQCRQALSGSLPSCHSTPSFASRPPWPRSHNGPRWPRLPWPRDDWPAMAELLRWPRAHSGRRGTPVVARDVRGVSHRGSRTPRCEKKF